MADGELGRKVRACGSCGMGTMWLTNVRGMVMGQRDDPRVRIRTDLLLPVLLPVCDACGDMAIDPVQARALDAALDEAYAAKRRKLQRALLNDLRRRGFTQGQIERFACVRPGYLSELRKGKIASASTFRLLYVLHELPDAAWAVLRRLDPSLPSLDSGTSRRSPVRS